MRRRWTESGGSFFILQDVEERKEDGSRTARDFPHLVALGGRMVATKKNPLGQSTPGRRQPMDMIPWQPQHPVDNPQDHRTHIAESSK